MVLQKMNRKGFTLVELIVVITILAILGTIAFLSFQGYSSNARDSKRKNDIQSIVSAVNLKRTGGLALLNLVDTSKNTQTATNFSVGGATGSTADYAGGVPNYVALDIAATNFQDPDGQDYRVGASTKAGGVFEVLTSLEADGTTKQLGAAGNYSPRVAKTILLSPATAAGGTSLSLSGSTDIGFLKDNDTLSAGVVKNVSGDGKTITLNAAWAAGGSSTTFVAESAHLVTLTAAGLPY